ncbi:MAG: hypothetical protein AAGD96_20125 [Chloroflexota bacterium]
MTLKRGLTLGKYAPLHAGHQLVIELGLAEMDAMWVIVYDSPSITPIPLPVRTKWIKTIYPAVKVIEAWGGPEEVGYTAEIKKAHEDYIIKTLGVTGVTHFYSSEPYGEHMSIALGAIDRRVDPDRLQIPISGTELRQKPRLWRQFLHPIVAADMRKFSSL